MLNVTYLLLTEHADEKQKRDIDDKLYGWGAMNEKASKALWDDGGEG